MPEERTYMEIPDRIRERVLAKAVKSGDCLLSQYGTGNHGYPQIGWKQDDGSFTVQLVHRVAWYMERGPVPSGMVVERTCGYTSCIAVKHMRLQPKAKDRRKLHMTTPAQPK